MRVTVIGAGYVGLTSALALAHFGNEVVCLERDGARLRALGSREDPLGEPGLAELLTTTTARFAESDRAMADASVVLVAVGTPMRADGHADLAQLDLATRTVAAGASAGAVVLVRSTVPVGTCDRLQSSALVRQLVVSNPAFLREGQAVADTFAPDRVVAGGPVEARATVRSLYEPILAGRALPPDVERGPERPSFLWMSARSAELAKYAANGFLATKLSFANEIANLAAVVGADARAVLEAMSLDPRIGRHHLRPGLGWGGSCFPKDSRALEMMADGHGYEFLVLKAAIEQNRRQLRRLVRAIAAETSASATIAILGLAFKAGTSDTRESPAVALAHELLESGRRVRAYDPMVRASPAAVPGIELFPDSVAACEGADAIVVATEWPEFASLDLGALRRVSRGDLLFDGRSITDPEAVAAAGFRYRGFGGNEAD